MEDMIKRFATDFEIAMNRPSFLNELAIEIQNRNELLIEDIYKLITLSTCLNNGTYKIIKVEKEKVRNERTNTDESTKPISKARNRTTTKKWL